jgi:hypothetical protein
MATIFGGADFAAGLLQFDAPDGDSITVRALLFYEGKHADMGGRVMNATVKKIKEIATATNAWISSGRRVKLYASPQDHAISQLSAIGILEGPVETEEITAENSPLDVPEIIGKLGIFGTVKILGAGPCDQYRQGLLKELSVGITPKEGIVEVSAVAISSLVGAALYAAGRSPEEVFEEALQGLNFALSLSDRLAEDSIQRNEMQLYQLFEAFIGTLRDIREASPDELNGAVPADLRNAAVNDLLLVLRSQLQIVEPAAPAPLPALPLFSGVPMDELEQFKAQIETLQSASAQTTATLEATQAALFVAQRQNSLFALRSAACDRYSELKTKASGLVSRGKMTPAQRDAKFSAATVPALATFADLDAAETAISGFSVDLDKLETLLDFLEEHATPIQFGMPTKGREFDEPGATAAQKSAEVDSFLASHRLPRDY